MEDKTNKNEVKSKHRKTSKIIFVLCITLAVLMVLALITSVALLFFPVSEIEVVGDSRYDYSRIIEVSGIKKGARLYYINEQKAENTILSELPYLKSVKINSYFPNRVKIEIEEYEDIYLIPHTNGYCYVNGNFEILEIIEQAADYEQFSGVFIKLEKSAEGEIGAIYQSEDTKRASDLIEHIKEYGFYQNLNIVDVSHKYNNSFVVGKKYKFVIGAMTDISEKIDAAFKVCLRDSFENEENAVINVTNKKKVALQYVNDEKIRLEFDFCQK